MKNWTSRLTLAVFAAAILVTPMARAEDAAADEMAALVESQAELHKEMAALREEVAGLKVELQKMLAEMRKLNTAAKPKPKQARRRPALDLLGKPAPAHTFSTHQGSEVSLGGESDKVKLAFFYASWCGYCKRALPGIEGLRKQYEGKDVEIVAINLDDRTGRRAKTEEESIKHYNSLKLAMPLLLDGEKKVGRSYKVSSFPTSFVIGKNGVVEAVHVGGPVGLDATIAKEFETLLAGGTLLKPEEKAAKEEVGAKTANQ